MAVSPAMLTNAFPANERGRALGMNAVIVALGVSVGPTLGGLITESFTWRWIFYVNVPIGIIGIIVTLLVLKEPLRRNPGRFDPIGALLLAVGLIALTAGPLVAVSSLAIWSSLFSLPALVAAKQALVDAGVKFAERGQGSGVRSQEAKTISSDP